MGHNLDIEMIVEITYKPPSHWACAYYGHVQSWLIEISAGPGDTALRWVSSNEIMTAEDAKAAVAEKYCGDWSFRAVEVLDYLGCR